ncbi:hypothetical protein H311_01696 [Anncaliia algerae PRA109]|nr:hypothetical protein H311_01696 [Anncaliia algerae PRA109]
MFLYIFIYVYYILATRSYGSLNVGGKKGTFNNPENETPIGDGGKTGGKGSPVPQSNPKKGFSSSSYSSTSRKSSSGSASAPPGRGGSGGGCPSSRPPSGGCS